MSKWIRKGDKVVVITGNDKGKTGNVISRKEDKVIVQGINIRKKHAKRRTQASTPTILEREMPFHVSNVMICDSEGNPVKLKVRVASNGEKELFYIDQEKEILYRQVKKHS
jgi:large subunit ribosomal protein L24